MSAEQSKEPQDLGFRYRVRKGGDVEITHCGRLAATLRGAHAAEFLAEAPESADPEAQQLMARLTGNYKRGNERLASSHPRNRR
jgi:antitoxin (DNA-binding transcriptional repressor) of toxin-antitoxin stability system